MVTPLDAVVVTPTKDTFNSRSLILIPNPHLGILDMEIVCADLVVKGNPNSFAMEVALNNLKSLGKPIKGLTSDVTDSVPEEGIYIYRTAEFEIRLNRGELERFLRHNLKPQEFFSLFAKYGNVHEIHDDFYDPDTGEAFQPME